MKASELRIGNWVQPIGECIQITGVDTIEGVDYIKIWGQYHHIKGIEPIPITKEWLEKFGFDKEDRVIGGFFRYFNQYLRVTFYKNSDCELSQRLGYTCGHLNIKYVHQLQNLYFALTGEEL